MDPPRAATRHPPRDLVTERRVTVGEMKDFDLVALSEALDAWLERPVAEFICFIPDADE